MLTSLFNFHSVIGLGKCVVRIFLEKATFLPMFLVTDFCLKYKNQTLF